MILVPEDESSDYNVEINEDDSIAFVSPAIEIDDAEEHNGVVFLGKDAQYDTILIFDGDISYEGDTMRIPLRKTEDIMVNEVFSDGKMAVEEEQKKRLLKSPGVSWNTKPSGNNWSGKITDFDVDWPKAGVNVDVWDLLFELELHLRFSLDFDIETTGASGRERTEIANITVPVKLFSFGVTYSLDTQFDSTPIHVVGTMSTEFSLFAGSHGSGIKKYRTPVKISKLEVLDGRSYNKDINFYIGSTLTASCEFMHIELDLWLFEINIGPLLGLYMDNSGGCHIKANHRKNQFEHPDTSKGSIHTCLKNGKDGCLSLEMRETRQINVRMHIDIYFKSWDPTLYDSGEQDVRTWEYYNSYTHRSGMQEGRCPHELYKVPVHVQYKEDRRPVNGSDVTVSSGLDVPGEDLDFTAGTTNTDGDTVIWLPYKDGGHTIGASVVLNVSGKDVQYTGSKAMSDMRRGENARVVIELESNDKVSMKVNVDWHDDAAGKEHNPGSFGFSERFQIQRRAGNSGNWESIENGRIYTVGRDDSWQKEISDLDVCTMINGKAVLYQYRARVVADNSEAPDSTHYNSGLVPDETGTYDGQMDDELVYGDEVVDTSNEKVINPDL